MRRNVLVDANHPHPTGGQLGARSAAHRAQPNDNHLGRANLTMIAVERQTCVSENVPFSCVAAQAEVRSGRSDLLGHRRAVTTWEHADRARKVVQDRLPGIWRTHHPSDYTTLP